MKRCRPRYNDGPDWYGGGKHVWFCEEHCDAIVWWLGNLGGGGRCGWFSRAAKDGKVKNSAQAEGRGGQHSTALGSAGPRNISCHCQFATFQAGNSDAVGLFIDQTDSVRYINELNKEHEGPLHFASRSQSLQPETITLFFFIEWSQEWWQTYSGALGEQWSKGDDSKTIFKSLFKIVL